jgi:hypothetical protein
MVYELVRSVGANNAGGGDRIGDWSVKLIEAGRGADGSAWSR